MTTRTLVSILIDMKEFGQWESDEEDRLLLKRCKESVRQLDPAADVILYGSRARREASEESDFDLLILTGEHVDLAFEDRIRDLLYPLEMETGRVLSFFVYNRNQWRSSLYTAMPFHASVEREGVLL